MKLKMLIDSMEKVNYIHSFREEDVIEYKVNRQKELYDIQTSTQSIAKSMGCREETMALHVRKLREAYMFECNVEVQ